MIGKTRKKEKGEVVPEKGRLTSKELQPGIMPDGASYSS